MKTPEVLRYAFWPAMVLAPWLIVLTWVPPSGRLPLGNPLFTYFLTFVLVVGVILSLILRHLIQRSKRRPLAPAKIYSFMEDVLRMDPTAERFHEAGVFCCEAGQWDRAIEYLGHVGPEKTELYNSARYHMLIAYLESDRIEEASRLQASLGPEALTSDQRYNVALAYKKHHFLGRAKELFLKLFLMDIGFRDVGKQLEEIQSLERSGRWSTPEFQFLAGAISERYLDVKVKEDAGRSVVCTAHDRDLGRQVVLRALKPRHASEEEIEAFLSEARSLASFDHPAILKVYDIRKDRLPYFSTEPFEGRPASELAGRDLAERVRAIGRMLDLAEYLGGFEPESLLAGEKGEVRLVSAGQEPRRLPYRFIASLLKESEELSPPIEHARRGALSLLEASAPLAQVRHGIEALDTALHLDAEARERAAFAATLAWIEQVHRHYVHALKSKFAVIKRFPGEVEKALSIFGREANLAEIDKLLTGLEMQLGERRGRRGAGTMGPLAAVLSELSALDVAAIRSSVRGLARPEAASSSTLAELAETFVRLSAGIAKLLEGLEVDVASVSDGVVRGSTWAPSVRFEQSGVPGWIVRAARPQELREDLRTSLDSLLANAFEASAKAVTVRLARSADGRFVSLEVEDDGRGLPAELLERLSRERFSVKAGASGKPGSTGTGIVSAMRLMERHGGMLELANRPGAAGARATLTLPTMTD